ELSGIDFSSQFTEKHYIQNQSTPLGEGKVFEQPLDVDKLIKNVNIHGFMASSSHWNIDLYYIESQIKDENIAMEFYPFIPVNNLERIQLYYSEQDTNLEAKLYINGELIESEIEIFSSFFRMIPDDNISLDTNDRIRVVIENYSTRSLIIETITIRGDDNSESSLPTVMYNNGQLI